MCCRAFPLLFTAMLFSTLASDQRPPGQMVTKTETFDRDPNWEGLNHRAAKPRKMQQDFGSMGKQRSPILIRAISSTAPHSTDSDC